MMTVGISLGGSWWRHSCVYRIARVRRLSLVPISCWELLGPSSLSPSSRWNLETASVSGRSGITMSRSGACWCFDWGTSIDFPCVVKQRMLMNSNIMAEREMKIFIFFFKWKVWRSKLISAHFSRSSFIQTIQTNQCPAVTTKKRISKTTNPRVRQEWSTEPWDSQGTLVEALAWSQHTQLWHVAKSE